MRASVKLDFMIKPEYLRMFATVAETQALNEAAERLGRTPSAISMTLKQIEDSPGGPLFEGERKAALTPLGAFALRNARRAVAEHDAATAATRRFARGEEGEVRIADVPSAATRLLPGAVARLRCHRPGIRIDLRDTDSTAVVQAVIMVSDTVFFDFIISAQVLPPIRSLEPAAGRGRHLIDRGEDARHEAVGDSVVEPARDHRQAVLAVDPDQVAAGAHRVDAGGRRARV